MSSRLAQLMASSIQSRSNLVNAIYEEEWEDVPFYLNEMKEINDIEGTALHAAYIYNGTPYNIFRMLIDIYPDAATIQNIDGNTPLHYSIEKFSDQSAILLLEVAPETMHAEL